jgi:hypothetical protein
LLINNYLILNSENINIKYSIHESNLYGSDINENNLYFISNYCFTEIQEIHREKYVTILMPKVNGGFITWQTVFGVSLDYINKLKKPNVFICEEEPQTAFENYKNYFVCF